MAVLEVEALFKAYGGNTVVDHLDLTVPDGEFLTLLGPSGCGKTTTLRAIAGLVEIDGGEIRFDGRRMNEVPPHKRSTAMVFQSYALFPHMNVRENIGFGLRMRRVSGRELARRVEEAMAMVGLEPLAERSPGQLSGGQQQRVALARAVVTRPDLLLFDEPLSNLDAKLRERLRIDIRELQRRLKITSVYVTHDQAEALVMSDRIAVLNNGRIEQLGDPSTIYRHPATGFTAEFIGQANILKASVVSVTADGCELDTPVGRLASAETPADGRSEVLIAWRPEEMIPFVPGMRNRIAATVTQTIYMGNITDVLLDAGGTPLRLEQHGSASAPAGSTIELAVPPDKIQVLR
ncbi:ABC transporter ATP-binding protein [Acrocarpospora corrugata]|uniref:ABC transporter ATP-binding protein n=1 Tax=Acrocarpospora corrugata TaxID=35763 RepID=A0A5M3VY34_9ACTN|nr:ABC transporter ATP-binding protein [Acrocarpospora corrugata]GES01715.1 ABC transporter ATP-binding protein [Acrocarpospora corrugata]